MGRWIRIVEQARRGTDPQLRWYGSVRPHQSVTVGREGTIAVGASPVDHRVSRHAATVTADDRGWSILPTNRNGVLLHPWAQPSQTLHTIEHIIWPRVGVRVVGHPDIEHWVLLEDDEAYTKGAARYTTGFTEYATPPRPLTDKQLQTVREVFGALLAWPPRPDSQVRLIKQAATQMHVTESAVQERLNNVRDRAAALGLARQDVELTDPEYFYALVRAGYIQPHPSDLHRPLRVAEPAG